MTAPEAVFIHSEALDALSYPDISPFKTSRAGLTRRKLAGMGLLDSRAVVPPFAAGRKELEAFHDPAYLDALQRAAGGDLDAEGFNMGLGTPDCPVFRDLYDYATLAVGASLTAAESIRQGRAAIAFNPSGGFHHAGRAHAAGFCYLNDVVLAILRFTEAGRRVLFLDIDVHHCDGVQDAFETRDDVLVASLHESGKTLFPGTGFEGEIGSGPGRGYTLNVPLPAGTRDRAYLRAFREAVWPVIRAYGPDVTVLEMGMDGLAGDPLAHLRLTNNVHAEILKSLRGLDTPILVTGGGGYHVDNTVRGWALAWATLTDNDPAPMAAGMGGVLLGSTEWAGGLRDPKLPEGSDPDPEVDREVDAVADRIRKTVFPFHGL